MTKEIQLTQGKVAIVDDGDYEYLSQFKWFARKNTNVWYAQRHSPYVDGKRKTIHMHREIMSASGEHKVDHLDGNGLNNVRSNLRLATQAQNQYNRPKQANNASGFKGVHLRASDNVWVAHITHDGIRKHLGRFSSSEEAARAYDAAAKEFHGEFARLNFDLGGVELV